MKFSQRTVSSQSKPKRLSDLPSHGRWGAAPVAGPVLPPIRVLAKRFGVALALLAVVLPALVAGLAVSGMLTPLMEERATQALRDALPPGFAVESGKTSVELDFPAALAVRFEDVSITRDGVDMPVASLGEFALTLRTGPLLRGRPQIAAIRVSDADVLLPMTGGRRPNLSVAALDGPSQAVFEAGNAILTAVRERAPGLDVSLSDITISVPESPDNAAQEIRIQRLRGLFDDGVVASGSIGFASLWDGPPIQMALRGTVADDGALSTLEVSSSAFPVPARGILFAFSNVEADRDPTLERPPISSAVSLLLEKDDASQLTKTLQIRPESIAFKLATEDEVPALFELALQHRFGDTAISVLPRLVRIGRTRFVLNGGIRDAPGRDGAFEMELLANQGVLNPIDTPVREMEFASVVKLIVDPQANVIDVPAWRLETPGGEYDANGQFDLGASPPVVVMRVTSQQMSMEALKQTWPAPVARGARRWVLANVAGGQARNIVFDVAEPLRRRIEGLDTQLTGDTNVSLDMDGVRFDIAGELPPLRDAVGRLSFENRVATITLDSGTVFMPGGATAQAQAGVMTILPRDESGNIKATVSVQVRGEAASVGQLISYRPITAQRFYAFDPDDLSGNVVADVAMDFVLNDINAEGGPDWSVQLDVSDAASAKPVEDRQLRDVNGSISINRQRAEFDIDAQMDGLPTQISMLIPFEGSDLAPKRTVTMKLTDAERNTLAPGLDEILTGTTPVRIEQGSNGANRIEMDLADSVLSLPWVGWSKGRGVSGSAAFDLLQANGTTRLQDFRLSGDGFAARGAVRVTNAGLSALDFSNVKLNRFDDFNIAVRRDGARYLIDVTGKALDARSLIRAVRSAMRETGSGGEQTAVTLTARIDRVLGFGDEQMRNVEAEILIGKRGVESAQIEALTDSGVPVSVSLTGIGAQRRIALEALDAGDLLRFADLYGQVRGGVLTANLSGTASGNTVGAMRMTDFRVFNEPRLASLVNTKASDSGSLRDAVRRDIDTSEVRFDLAFADVNFGQRTLDLQRGVLRGPLVGLTMQGRAYDASNQMRITGTFLPAYGLNTLFADIPIFGALLGNGRDRGLIGVTFLLTGKADKPTVTVNPLSAIAPGIFRSIFEFR